MDKETKRTTVSEYLAQEGFAALSYSVRERKTSPKKAIEFLLKNENAQLINNEQWSKLNELKAL